MGHVDRVYRLLAVSDVWAAIVDECLGLTADVHYVYNPVPISASPHIVVSAVMSLLIKRWFDDEWACVSSDIPFIACRGVVSKMYV